MKKKRGICWFKDCQAKYVLQIKLSFTHTKPNSQISSGTLITEHRLCMEHARSFYHDAEWGPRTQIEKFIGERS